MDELIAFVTARLDEDEARAKDHLCISCGLPVVPLRNALGVTGYTHEGGRVNAEGDWENTWQGRRCPGRVTGAEHVQNPARVLREVAAGRRILARHECCAPYGGGPCDHAGTVDDPPCPDMRDLAARWSGHPDHKQEWAP